MTKRIICGLHVHNSERWVGYCIASIYHAVDHIIIGITRQSSDKTRSILSSLRAIDPSKITIYDNDQTDLTDGGFGAVKTEMIKKCGELGADWILNAPTYCNICHGQNLHFSARTSKAKSGKNAGKEFSYAQMRCKTKDCWSTATLGKFADGSGYFWRDGGKFVKYEGGNNNKNSQTTKEDTALAPSDDIPF